jgi:mRNA-degrading endonuclease RelE of RelBE toxin-antitoxin system
MILGCTKQNLSPTSFFNYKDKRRFTTVHDQGYGELLKQKLDGLRKYRVRRFRIVYAVHQKTRTIRLMAVGHRRSVYEELTERIRQKTSE